MADEPQHLPDPSRLPGKGDGPKRRGSPSFPAQAGDGSGEPVRITLIRYDAEHLEETEVESVEACLLKPDESEVVWINVDGVHKVDIIERLATHYGIHPLVAEDVVHTRQRPKLEDYGDFVYLVLRMLTLDEATGEVDSEQVSLVMGRGFVLSFLEDPGDVFDPVRDRIRNAKGRIRQAGADYLVYALMDAVVDSYFIICEAFGERLEDLEERAINDPTAKTSHAIHAARRELISLRRAFWPLRDVISALQRGESPLVAPTTKVYLRDVYDHTIQVIDAVESFRDIAAGLLDIYLSSISNRMNEVMKVLTVIATVFIPLTFIAGVYGMNFVHMPELRWRWAYPALWVVMIAIALGMLRHFRRKGWM